MWCARYWRASTMGSRLPARSRPTHGWRDARSSFPARARPEMAVPQLSVVIASCVGPPFITRCLESLAAQRQQGELEFLVVDRAGGDVAAGIAHDFPWVRLIRRPPGESVPDLRRHGIAAARADYVAIIEEH